LSNDRNGIFNRNVSSDVLTLIDEHERRHAAAAALLLAAAAALLLFAPQLSKTIQQTLQSGMVGVRKRSPEWRWSENVAKEVGGGAELNDLLRIHRLVKDKDASEERRCSAMREESSGKRGGDFHTCCCHRLGLFNLDEGGGGGHVFIFFLSILVFGHRGRVSAKIDR
jgi:hypothetical protein